MSGEVTTHVKYRFSTEDNGKTFELKGLTLTNRKLKELSARMKVVKATLSILKFSFKELRSILKSVTSPFTSFLSQLIIAKGIFGTFRTATNLLTRAFKESFHASEAFNISIAQQAAIITSISKRSKGETLPELYKRATSYAQTLNDTFIRINKNTATTFEEMSMINKELLKSGVLIDPLNEKQLKGFEALNNAIAIFTAGMPDSMNQARQEANAVLNGLSGKGRDVANYLKSVLGSRWSELIDDWRRDGTVLEHFAEIFKGFDTDLGGLQNTWKVVGSSIKTTIQNILKLGFDTYYQRILENVSKINTYLNDHKIQIGVIISEGWSKLETIVIDVINYLINNLPKILSSMTTGFSTLKTMLFSIKDILDSIKISVKSVELAYLKAKRFKNEFVGKSTPELMSKREGAFESYKQANEELKKLTKTKLPDILKGGFTEKGFKWLIKDQSKLVDIYRDELTKLNSELEKRSGLEKEIAEVTTELEGLTKKDILSDKNETIKETIEDVTDLKSILDKIFKLQLTDKQLFGEEKLLTVVENFKLVNEELDGIEDNLADIGKSFKESVTDNITSALIEWTDGVKKGEKVIQNFLQAVSDSLQRILSEKTALAIVDFVSNIIFPEKAAVKAVGSVVGSTIGAITGTQTQSSSSLGTNSLPSGLGTSSLIDKLSNRPIQTTISFSDSDMIKWSRQLDKANYTRSELTI